MKTLRDSDIFNIVKKYNPFKESIDPVIGCSGDSPIAVFRRGLVLVHKKSGLEYTVNGIQMDDPCKPIVHCSNSDTRIEITPDQFKEYERRQ
tara:strand:- start:150 stop:425 length:276 start_codon:yes stop_codon:yes gene_type:complete